MSKVSRWLAAPVRKTMITDFGLRALERLEVTRGGPQHRQRREADSQKP